LIIVKNSKELGDIWDEGNKQFEEGNKLTPKGKSQIEDGENNMKKGRKMAEEGMEKMAASEAAFDRLINKSPVKE